MAELKYNLTRFGGPSGFTALDFLGQCVINSEHTAVELGAVHIIHGGGGVFSLKEGYEAEGAVLLRSLVQWGFHILNVSKRDEGGMEYALVHLLRQSADVQRVLLHSLVHSLLFL